MRFALIIAASFGAGMEVAGVLLERAWGTKIPLSHFHGYGPWVRLIFLTGTILYYAMRNEQKD